MGSPAGMWARPVSWLLEQQAIGTLGLLRTLIAASLSYMSHCSKAAAALAALCITAAACSEPAEDRDHATTECVINIHAGGHVPANCPTEPATCPDPTVSGPPSYKTDVAPLLNSSCVGCHNATTKNGYALDTHEDVARAQSDVAYSLTTCKMPPENCGFTLSPAERRTFLTWLSCGAPAN